MLDLLSDVEFMSGAEQSSINMSLYSNLDNLTKSGGDKYDIFRWVESCETFFLSSNTSIGFEIIFL